ncbi:uncharacterized protein LOC110179588 [Drosophila serrata]|uniref:uncharacterized protein LOC110179588 n=1 Tax=Drosophila serrata TaxID=7274 RepID=UPI000A1D1C60|nr:uncharacterized protein LOC110179588 [Drosophila serrata]
MKKSPAKPHKSKPKEEISSASRIMCLLLSFGCCGCSGSSSGSSSSSSSSPSAVKKQLEKKPIQEQEPEPDIQEQQSAITSPQSEQPASQDFIGLDYQVTDSMSSLPISMSLSLMALPLPTTYSSNCSSWAAEDEFCDMDEYEERKVWMHNAPASDLKVVVI